jgi:hypothetical protein
MTKQQEIRMAEEQLAKEKEVLDQLTRYSAIEQSLPGSDLQMSDTSTEIRRAESEMRRLQERLDRLRPPAGSSGMPCPIPSMMP